ncbi:MAG: Type 1 glutamine amidotransferase-like domain-containing protein [Nitrospiraceae bacterium]|nr:MAG: Type 1 glutamine amidotransferase-like domain-containing protein [Nitrospiraceae bacterium]
MGILALVGGDEFRENCIEMDRYILSLASRSKPNVVILPTAAAFENPQLAAQNGVRYFNTLGARTTAAMILDHEDAHNREKTAPLEHADIIYLTGGDPWHLLSAFKGSPAWDTMLKCYQKGGIVAGSSAGAMVLSGKMRNQDSSGWIDALNLAGGIAVLPHHDSSRPDNIKSLRDSLEPEIALIGISAATACIHTEHQTWHVAGNGLITLYRKHSCVVYGKDKRFSI